MARIRLDVEVPDGQHLGFSRDTDGAYRAHLFDDATNGLVGHAELFEPDEGEQDTMYMPYDYYPESAEAGNKELSDEELAEVLGVLIGLGVIVATQAAAAAPHVKKWWTDKAVPAMKSVGGQVGLTMKSVSDHAVSTVTSARMRLAGNRGVERANDHEPESPLQKRGGDESSTELTAAFVDYRLRMGLPEARERFVQALMARAFSDEQLRLLSRAEFEDDGGLDLRAAMESLTAQQVGNTITKMLEKNPSLTDQGSLAELRAVFGRNRISGTSAPLRIERLKERL